MVYDVNVKYSLLGVVCKAFFEKLCCMTPYVKSYVDRHPPKYLIPVFQNKSVGIYCLFSHIVTLSGFRHPKQSNQQLVQL